MTLTSTGTQVRATAAGLWVPGGSDGLLQDLLSGRPRQPGLRQRADPPDRPEQVAVRAWRRMSRLTRMVLATATPLLVDRDDRVRIAVVWGNCLGELVPISRFLERLYSEGPKAVSPLNFQNSVNNAPVGHLSLALKLHGPSETLSAGGATGAAALMRGIDLLRLGIADSVLVIAGDDLNATSEAAWELHGHTGVLGEAIAAIVLERQGDGPRVEVGVGISPVDGAPLFARQALLPGESALTEIDGSVAPEACLGLVPSGGLAVLAAMVQSGRAGSLIERDGEMVLTASVMDERMAG
jgi:hypothetical protein